MFRSGEAIDNASKECNLPVRGFAEVAGHQLPGPSRLVDFSSRSKAPVVRFQVEHRRSVHGIEFADTNVETIDALEATSGHTNTIGAILSPLREDADVRLIGPAERKASSCNDLFIRDSAEIKDDFDVGVFGEARGAVGRKPGGVELNCGNDAAPAIV